MTNFGYNNLILKTPSHRFVVSMFNCSENIENFDVSLYLAFKVTKHLSTMIILLCHNLYNEDFVIQKSTKICSQN